MTKVYAVAQSVPEAYLYENDSGDRELVLDCNGEYACRLLENGYREIPLYSRIEGEAAEAPADATVEALGWAKATAWHKHGIAWKHLERVSQQELLTEARAFLASKEQHDG
jgi:hypothetical protein